VVVPYTRRMEAVAVLEAVTLALEGDGQEADFVDVSSGDSAYFELWTKLWASGETFVVIEHDVVVYPGAIQTMLDCASPWCVTDYMTCGSIQYGFGCVKFDGGFTRAYPHAFTRMAEGIDFVSAHEPTHWKHLDAQLGAVLSRMADMAWPHRHQPAVTHLNREHFPR